MRGDDERGNDPVPLVFEECERLDERKDDAGVVGTRVDSMVQHIEAKPERKCPGHWCLGNMVACQRQLVVSESNWTWCF